MKRIRNSELRSMEPEDRDRALAEAIKATRRMPNGELKDIEQEIRVYETRLRMTSEQMKRELADGKLLETSEICTWLIALQLRDRLAAFTPRA